MEAKKASSDSTEEAQESIAPDEHITDFPFWTEDVNGTPKFWGTHWECELCNAMSSLGPAQIRHTDDCPLAGTEVAETEVTA